MAKMNWRAIGPMVERRVPEALHGEGVAAMKPILEAVVGEFIRAHSPWAPRGGWGREADMIREEARYHIRETTAVDGQTGKPYHRWLEVFYNGEQLVVDPLAGPPDLIKTGLDQLKDDLQARQLELERLRRDYPEEFEDSEDDEDGADQL
jgi:hypothetical protein